MPSVATHVHPANRRVAALLGHSLLSHLALFALVPFLPLLLSDTYGLAPGAAGATLLMFNVVLRSGSVVVNEFVERVSPGRAAAAGLAVSGTALLVLGTVGRPLLVVALLAVVAAGVSISGVVARALLAAAAGDRDGRARAFAQLSVVANVAAGIAPLATGVLTDWSAPTVVFAVSGMCYLLAGAVIVAFVRVPARGAGTTSGRSPLRLAPYLAMLRHPPYRRLLGASVVFWFFYAQQFAALPVYLHETTGSRTLIGSVYAVDAVLVIVLQVPITALVLRRLTGAGRRPISLVFPLGMLALSGYLALLAAGAPALGVVYAAAALFALAVMVVVPVMDTLYADLAPADRQVTAFNARKLTWALGEGTGAFVGVSGQLWLASAVGLRAFWWSMAAAAAVLAVVLYRLALRDVAPQAPAAEPPAPDPRAHGT